MSDKLIMAAAITLCILVADLFYIFSFSHFLLRFFEKRYDGNIPFWFRIMNNIANIFGETPLNKKEREDRELFLKASSHQFSAAERSYMGLKIKLPQNPQRKTSFRLRRQQEETDKPEKTKEIDSKDIETCQQYYTILNTILDKTRQSMEGIEFTRTHTITYITEGDMTQYNHLNKIRKNFVEISGLILKAKIKTDVQEYFSNVHFHFHNYISQSVTGLNKLMDYIYHGDRRMLEEGHKSLLDASKALTEIQNRLKVVDIEKLEH